MALPQGRRGRTVHPKADKPNVHVSSIYYTQKKKHTCLYTCVHTRVDIHIYIYMHTHYKSTYVRVDMQHTPKWQLIRILAFGTESGSQSGYGADNNYRF